MLEIIIFVAISISTFLWFCFGTLGVPRFLEAFICF